jgi:hypothetical protein
MIILISNVKSFINKNINMISNLFLERENMINYLTSIKDYTIITVGERNRIFESQLLEKNLNVYYVNLENIIDYKDILEYLNKKYIIHDSGGEFWIFFKGFYLGSKEEFDYILNKK